MASLARVDDGCGSFAGVTSRAPFLASDAGSKRPSHVTAFGMFKSWLVSRKDWEMNPVLLKELRQATRNRILLSALMVLLASLFLVSVMFLMRHELMPVSNEQVGRPVFQAFLIILTVISVIFVPLYTGIRLALERRETDRDLMFITTLPPGKIIRGKMFCGAYLVSMFFSICAPFMVFTNLLRGVDLPTVGFVLFCLHLAACFAIQGGIALACFPAHSVFKILSGLAFAMCLFAFSYGFLHVCFDLLRSGLGVVGKTSFWLGFLMLILLALGGIRFLHCIALDLLISDNRPRGYFNEVIKNEDPVEAPVNP
jgi:hypothetical protein